MFLKGDNYAIDNKPSTISEQKKTEIKSKIRDWVPKISSKAMYDFEIIKKLQKEEGENFTNDQLMVCFQEIYDEYNPLEVIE